MTVKELKEQLYSFPDHCIVMIPGSGVPWSVPVIHISQGCNEADNCVFLDSYEEDE